MNTSTPKKPALWCRLHRWLASIRSKEHMVEVAKSSRHVKHCSDCQHYYKAWQKLQGELYRPLGKEDESECGAIMAQIRNLPVETTSANQGHFLSRLKPTLPWQWASAAVCLVVIMCVGIFWGMKDDSGGSDVTHSKKDQEEQQVATSEGDQAPSTSGSDPMEMLAAIQKEQTLIARDLGKFRTMLNERVIIFRQEP